MRTDENEQVMVAEIRGLAAENIRDAFREMHAIASGTRCTNYFYHANLNPRDDERLTPQQWEVAADTLERELGLTGQPRIIVEHEKGGRTHRHVVWSRIDADSMTAISDSLTYQKHERAARTLEQTFGHDALDSVLVKDREKERPERNPKDWESFRGQESKRDPKAVKAEVTALWERTDSGQAFAAALREYGYILARGDRRDFCIIDAAGDDHSLARRVSGVKAAQIRARMADIDRAALPSVAEGRALARQLHHAADDPDRVQEASPGTARTIPRSQPAIAAPDAAAAGRQVRAMAAQFGIEELAFGAPRGRSTAPAQPRRTLPRFSAPADARIAAEQVQAIAMLFVQTIEYAGALPELIGNLIDDGIRWWQRATHYLAELAVEARDTVLGWRDYVRADREERDRDDDTALDFD